MTWLAPLALAAGALGAAGVVIVHLITTRRPPELPFPTARFVPVSDAQAIARARRPEDVLLLALRALAVLLVGAAFAQPVPDAPGPAVRTVVLVDGSSAVADPVTLAARASALAGDGGAVIAFDTIARELAPESLAVLGRRDRARPSRADLSAGLVAARRAASRVARGADSVRLVLLSPLAATAIDAATAPLRDAWPGRVELERATGVADTAAAPRAQLITGQADDALGPALTALPRARGGHEVRVVRAAPTPADLAWGSAGGRVLIHWPERGAVAVRGDGLTTLDLLGYPPAPLVAPLARLDVPGSEQAIARWRDGAPAATERANGGGCLRTIGIGLPDGGDLTLRSPFRRVLNAFVAPCGGARAPALPDSALTWLTREGPLASASMLVGAGDSTAPSLSGWLLVAALALLGAEWWLRSRRRA